MEQPSIIYLRKVWPAQPIWEWIASTDYVVPIALQFLVTTNRVYIGPESARDVLDWLDREGFSPHEPGTARMPVEVVDHVGNPVSLSDLAPTA